MKAKAVGADANAMGTACEQRTEKAHEETSRMQNEYYLNSELAGLSQQDLKEMWNEKYQFGMSQLRMTDEQARRLADRTLRAITETELEFKNGRLDSHTHCQ
jgi:hypothetical protein